VRRACKTAAPGQQQPADSRYQYKARALSGYCCHLLSKLTTRRKLQTEDQHRADHATGPAAGVFQDLQWCVQRSPAPPPRHPAVSANPSRCRPPLITSHAAKQDGPRAAIRRCRYEQVMPGAPAAGQSRQAHGGYHDRERPVILRGLASCASRTGIRGQELHKQSQRQRQFQPFQTAISGMPQQNTFGPSAPALAATALWGRPWHGAQQQPPSPRMGDQQKMLAGLAANSPRQYWRVRAASKSANGSPPGGVQP